MPAQEDQNGGRTLLLGCCEGSGEPAAEEKLKLLKSEVGRHAKHTIKYANQNKIFMGHISLALSTATLMAIFGLPLFSSHLRELVFGDHICDAHFTGLYLNKGNLTNPDLQKVELSSLEANEFSNLVNCGFIPASYKGYWPNVVQFCFFSVLTNTGTTVQLTLQGFFGTFLASVNIWMLYQIYPHGSQTYCPNGDNCAWVDSEYVDPNYSPYVVLAEAAFFSILWLVSKAPKNMVMFLGSYHVYFISQFLNSSTSGLSGNVPIVASMGLYWDSEPTIINLTSVLGGILAILATLIPKPLLNTVALQDNATTAVEGITNAWEASIEYFCGSVQRAERYSVAAKMDATKGAFDRTKDSINGAWFEHFDVGHFGVARELFRLFCEAGDNMFKLLQIAKTAMVRENFQGEHTNFCEGIKKEMVELNDFTSDLFLYCCTCCVDGHIDAKEEAELRERLEKTKAAEKKLEAAYRETMKSQPYVSEDLANENCFIFGFAAYVHVVVDLAEDLPKFATEKTANKCSTFWGGICGMLKDMFSCDMLLAPDNLKFSVVNFLPIVITFCIAYFADAEADHLFVSHSPLMPGTLALIITASYGSTFKGNIDRLIGLVLGNVIPLLVLAVVFSWPCESVFRTVTQSVLVFLYFFTFAYVYYSSKTWGFVGCALCGFGAYPLMVSCEPGAGGAGAFNFHMRNNYKIIGQTTVAILIRMFIETAFLDKSPRDLATEQLEDLMESIKDAYEEFFQGDFDAMKEKYDQVLTMLSSCETYYADTSPQLEVAPGPRLPFKHKFFGDVQTQLKVVIAELGVLVIGASEWKKAAITEEKSSMRQESEREEAKHRHAAHHTGSKTPLHGIMRTQSNFSLMEKDMLGTADKIFHTVIALLKQEKEEGLTEVQEAFQKLSGQSGMLDLEDAPGFYTQVNHHMGGRLGELKVCDSVVHDMQAKLTVVVNSLKTATAALGEIGILCLKENIY